jgi:hypothetical protein
LQSGQKIVKVLALGGDGTLDFSSESRTSFIQSDGGMGKAAADSGMDWPRTVLFCTWTGGGINNRWPQRGHEVFRPAP